MFSFVHPLRDCARDQLLEFVNNVVAISRSVRTIRDTARVLFVFPVLFVCERHRW